MSRSKPGSATTCGRSGNQPFCDGSHKETGLSLLAYVAETTEEVCFFGCKATADKPLRDGTHNMF